MALGLLLLRLTAGVTLSAHGAQKLFGWFGGPGLEKTGDVMASLGFVPGRAQALAAGLAELVGGLLLALGLATPLAASIVVGVMIVAAVSVHLPRGFFMTNGGAEYTIVLGVAGLTLAFTGPGPWSLDALVGLSFGGVGWGLAALVAGLAGSVVPLAGRRRHRMTHQPA
jgi:putative oxidoreductase